MTNTELIDLFRNVERSNHPVCNGCPMKYTCDKNQITRCLFGSAADALEAADKRIADQQKQITKLDILLDSKIEELEAQFLKEGEWKWNSLLNEYEWVDKTFYCPNCGVKMRKGEREKTESENTKSSLEYDYCGTPKRRYGIDARRTNDE